MRGGKCAALYKHDDMSHSKDAGRIGRPPAGIVVALSHRIVGDHKTSQAERGLDGFG